MQKCDVKNALNTSLHDVCSNITQYCENPNKDFLRNRKLPVCTLMRFLLNIEGNSLNSEIYNKFLSAKEHMTASALVQQRNKLKPEAFKALLHKFNSTLADPQTLKGLRVYAIDGSDFCTPLNKDSQWYIPHHHIRKDGQEAKGTCLLHGNFLYDLLNKQYIDVNETRDERDGAIRLIEDITDIEHSLTLMDRGYYGFNMIEHCNRSGGYYVICVPVSCIKEIAALPDESCDVDMEIKVSTKSNQFCQIYGYHKINIQKHPDKEYSDKTVNTRWDFEEKCLIKFRVCKFKINDPDTDKEIWEVLITNLSKDKFALKEMKRIYRHMGHRNLFQRT